MVAFGAAFAMKNLGIAALICLKNRMKYNRIVYERYLQCWWNFDGDPFAKIPLELRIN